MYVLPKTPRSSFMMRKRGLGDEATTSADLHSMTALPVVVKSPPFAPPGPSGVMPLTPAPPVMAPADTSSGLGQYVLWGGLAYLAYWLVTKR